MFRVGQADEHPLRIHPRLLERESDEALFPILVERTPVRLDLSHSGWSDIFFLGMDYPEGARVLNISVDLGVHGRDDQPRPPIETRLRVIPEPILRLTSIDLNACKDVDDARRAVQLRQRLSRAWSRRGWSPRGWSRRRSKGRATRLDDLLGAGRPARATGSRSSARSTTSPRGRGWRSRPTCWPR